MKQMTEYNRTSGYLNKIFRLNKSDLDTMYSIYGIGEVSKWYSVNFILRIIMQ